MADYRFKNDLDYMPSNQPQAIKDRQKMPPVCEGCGQNYSDPPSRLCVGCQAYQEHQR